MKTTYKYMLLAGLVVLAAGCEKEIEKESPADATTGKMITETISAQIEGETKATVNADAKFSWTVGDNIAVHVSNGNYVFTSGEGGASRAGGWASFTVSYPGGTSRDAFAIFPSTIVATDAANYGQSGSSLDVTLPATYTLAQVTGEKTPCPMIATNAAGSGWTFKQICGLLRLTISGIPTGTYSLKLDFNGKKVQGAFSIDSPVTPGASTIASGDCTKGTYDIIWITSESEISGPVTVNIPLPTGTYADLVVSAWDNSATPVALKAAVEPFSYTAAAAKGKKITSTLNKGVFSIASGKYAVFAPGNLQAVFTEAGTSCAWKFADHQYDITGDAAANNAVTHGGVSAAGTVDLFGFVGSNSEFDGLAQYGISNSTTMADYRTAGYILKSDWGNLEISGYAANTWRTPAGGDPGSEWSYLFQTRTDATSKYGHATVGGKNGLVVLPDSFIDPMKNNGSAAFVSGKVNYTDNVYTSGGNWEAMEAAGAFFLPSGGYRNGTTVGRFNEYGCYLTTGCSTITNFCMRINDKGLQANIVDDYFSGQSVRLVRDLN